MPLTNCERIKEWVFNDPNASEVLNVSLPSASLLHRGLLCDGGGSGWLCRSKVSHKENSLGSILILNEGGSCRGTWKVSKDVSSMSEKWKSLDRLSTITFSVPATLWLYRQQSAPRTTWANFQVTFIWAGWVASSKQDFYSQPTAEVLSIWLRMQDLGAVELSIISTQRVTTAAINSKQFRDTWKTQSAGNQKC